jgi:hypothetical protein
VTPARVGEQRWSCECNAYLRLASDHDGPALPAAVTSGHGSQTRRLGSSDIGGVRSAFVVDQSRIKAVMTVDSYGSPQKAAELLQRLHDETKTGR